jgi:hypothetical protein
MMSLDYGMKRKGKSASQEAFLLLKNSLHVVGSTGMLRHVKNG